MTLTACHIGIDKYPAGNALSKCVADAEGLAAIFDGELLLDKQCTRRDTMALVSETAKSAGSGVSFFGSVSGHGSQRKDKNKDEPDGIDETFVTVELDEILDDLFPSIISGRKRNNKGVFVFDSCFGGGAYRGSFSFGRNLSNAPRQIVRYLPPSRVKPKRTRAIKKATEAGLRNMVVMSACADFEFAYEGEEYGIWTGALIQTYDPALLIGEWFKAACKVVADGPYGAVQHPQIACSKAALKWRVPSI